MSKKLIITGDDFGLALPVNEAIEEAHRRGVLTTTSVLIGGAAAGDAIERAKRNPELRVGLHVALCEGRPILPPRQIPGLVNRRGELRHPVAALVDFALRPWLAGQIEAEMRAQFEAFRATGLALDHVNGHNHLQLHPVVLPILVKVAREYGARAIRLPYEPLLASWRAARRGLPYRLVAWLVMGTWGAYIRRRLARAGFAFNDYLFGIYDAGRMDLDLLLGLVRNLPEGVSEIHCHPATRRCNEIDENTPRYRHEEELSALTNPLLRQAIALERIQALKGFTDLPFA